MARRIIIALSIFLGTAIVLIINWPGVLRPPVEEAAPPPKVGGAFALIDMNGNPVTEAVLKGHPSLVYFGFTQCPDVCPLTLQKMTEALQMAAPASDTVMPVFITVDPAHDTPEVMKDYVSHFHPRFLGLTGTPEAIKQAENDYRIYAGKTTDGTSIAHGDLVYLMDANGKYVAQFPADVSAADMATRLRHELASQ